MAKPKPPQPPKPPTLTSPDPRKVLPPGTLELDKPQHAHALGIPNMKLTKAQEEELERKEVLRKLRNQTGLRSRNGYEAYLDSDDPLNQMTDPAQDLYFKQVLGVEPVFQNTPQDAPHEPPKPMTANSPRQIAEDQSARKALFIQEYISSGGMTQTAISKSGITRAILKEWKQDPSFQADLQEAEELWFEELRKAAFIRAQQKSDVLLIFLLKAMKPQVYDDDLRKAQWMATQGLLGNQNLPVRATLVRDNTFNVHLPPGTSPLDAQALRDQLDQLTPEGIPHIPSDERRHEFSPAKQIAESSEWSEIDDTAILGDGIAQSVGLQSEQLSRDSVLGETTPGVSTDDTLQSSED